MTSIFSSSWMCRLCGREACIDCFAYISKVADGRTAAPAPANSTPLPQREKSTQRGPYFLPCTKRSQHHPEGFSPVSRFCESELTQVIEDMEALLQSSVEEPTRPPEGTEHDLISMSPPVSSSSVEQPSSDVSPPAVSESPDFPAVPVPSSSDGAKARAATTASSESTIPSYRTTTLPHEKLTEDTFQRLWSSGDPLIVTGLLPRFRIQWTPEYFSAHYGAEQCTIIECQSEKSKEVSVNEFFSWFDDYKDRHGNWKLKVCGAKLSWLSSTS